MTEPPDFLRAPGDPDTDALTVAAAQWACGALGPEANIARAAGFVREAGERGAALLVLPELFETPYFCQRQEEDVFARAAPLEGHPALAALSDAAASARCAVTASVYERDGPHLYNTLVMLGRGGERLGLYRKSHIPDGPGYQEKFYFRPGNTGFQVFDTGAARVGAAVCWDQWFPEAARAMALKGAELLCYPTAIGTEPDHPGLDTCARWRRAMQGHAASNAVPVAAANRCGAEGEAVFYGSSFVCGPDGAVEAELGRKEEGLAIARFSRSVLQRERDAWGFFRDRRPDLYGALTAP